MARVRPRAIARKRAVYERREVVHEVEDEARYTLSSSLRAKPTKTEISKDDSVTYNGPWWCIEEVRRQTIWSTGMAVMMSSSDHLIKAPDIPSTSHDDVMGSIWKLDKLSWSAPAAENRLKEGSPATQPQMNIIRNLVALQILTRWNSRFLTQQIGLELLPFQ
jgi:hypothetical protein